MIDLDDDTRDELIWEDRQAERLRWPCRECGERDGRHHYHCPDDDTPDETEDDDEARDA